MSIFGPLLGPQNVEDAVVNQLRVWVRTYLAEIERQNGLSVGALYRPRAADAFYGGVDFDSWQQDDLPAYIVAVAATDDLEHTERGYGVWYRVATAVVCILPTEQESRRIAAFHGVAVMGAVLHRGGLGGISAKTRMISAPTVVLPDPEVTRLARCDSTYLVLVEQVIDDRAGPASPTPEESAEYGGDPEAPFTDWPIVADGGATFTLNAEE